MLYQNLIIQEHNEIPLDGLRKENKFSLLKSEGWQISEPYARVINLVNEGDKCSCKTIILTRIRKYVAFLIHMYNYFEATTSSLILEELNNLLSMVLFIIRFLVNS